MNINYKYFSGRVGSFIFLLASSIVLLAAAFFNGYPLVYSDTSTYLASGFEMETPPDRPITYGLFLRIFSLNGLSLWLAVFAQSFLLVFLIYRLLRVLKVDRPAFFTFLISFLCAFLTGISWVASQLIADVFTPMLILLWTIILLDNEASSKRTALYAFLFLIVSAMHMSHMLMSVAFILCMCVVRINKKARAHIAIRSLVILFVVSVISFLAYSSSYSKYKHVFFVAKLDENGILSKILTDKCGEKNFRLCAFRDSLPHDGIKFIWAENSPLKKLGGYKEVKAEFKEISSISLTESKYLTSFMMSSLKDSWRQLSLFGIADGNGPFGSGTLLGQRVSSYIPHEAQKYMKARQQAGKTTELSAMNTYFSIALSIILVLLLLFVWHARRSFPLLLAGFMLAIGIVSNAVVCGSLSSPSDRYGCRVVWLLLIYLVILVSRYRRPLKMK